MTANPFAASRPATATATRKKADDFDAPPSTKPVTDPFAMPTGGGGGERVADLLGSLLLVRPTEHVTGMTTSIGDAEAIRADVTILDGDRAGETVPDMLFFQIALRRDLSRILEGPSAYLLGRLGMGAKKPGKSAPFIFESPSEADKDIARQHLASR